MGGSRITPEKLAVELSQVPILPNRCKRCEYIFECPEGTPRRQAFQLMYEHWKTCIAGMSREQVASTGREVIDIKRGVLIADEDSPPPIAKRTRKTSLLSLGPVKRRKKNVMDEATRRQLIERDSWGRNATSKSVECKGCGKTIKLDRRSQYYPGLWHKHRNKCPDIRRLDARRGMATSDDGEATVEGDSQTLTRDTSPSSSVECVTEMRAARERVLRWTASLESRYNATPSHADTSRTEILEKSGNFCGSSSTASYIRRPVVAPNIIRQKWQDTIVTSTSDGVEYSDEESYLEAAPFEPDDNLGAIELPDAGGQRPKVYRYATGELVNSYKSANFADRKGDICSEDVIQAALCLVSMKSRAG